VTDIAPDQFWSVEHVSMWIPISYWSFQMDLTDFEQLQSMPFKLTTANRAQFFERLCGENPEPFIVPWKEQFRVLELDEVCSPVRNVRFFRRETKLWLDGGYQLAYPDIVVGPIEGDISLPIIDKYQRLERRKRGLCLTCIDEYDLVNGHTGCCNGCGMTSHALGQMFEALSARLMEMNAWQ
jgi:hypothetical protein